MTSYHGFARLRMGDLTLDCIIAMNPSQRYLLNQMALPYIVLIIVIVLYVKMKRAGLNSSFLAEMLNILGVVLSAFHGP